MFEKTRKAMLELSPASRRKVAGKVLELLKLKQERENGLASNPALSQPTKSDTSSDSGILTNSELGQLKQQRKTNSEYLSKVCPNARPLA